MYSLFFLALVFLFSSSLFFLSKLKSKSYLYKNLPPSPPKLPMIGNLHQLGKVPHRSLFKLSQKYGPVMLLQLGQVPTVVLSSPETAKQLLKTHDSLCCSRPRSYGSTKLSYNLLDIAFRPYSESWRDVKKLCVQEVFSVRKVQSFSRVREREVSHLINSISESAVAHKPVEIGEEMLSLTKNIICKIAFGKSDEEIKQAGSYITIEKAIYESSAMVSSFWVADFFPMLGWVVDEFKGLHRRLERTFIDFDMFYEKIIEEHLDPNRPIPEHEDVVDVLLGLAKLDETSTAHHHLSRDSIKAIIKNIFIGSIGTIADTILWAMTELIKNPTVMQKAQLEIRSYIGNEPLVPETEILNLIYLHMVVKETLRMHPPGTLLLRESTERFKINNYDVPANTRIYVNAWAIGRDPATWENPNEFRPERFEEIDVDFKGQHFELIPFGVGRRMCPGIVMGTTAVEFILANLLHSFDWELPVGVKAEDVNVEEEFGSTIHKKYPLRLVPIVVKHA